MSYANVEKISFIGNNFVSKRKIISGSEMISSTSTENLILQNSSENKPLFFIQDSNSLIESTSRRSQRHYCNYYCQFQDNQIQKLNENLSRNALKSESQFIQLVERFSIFPNLLQVPKFKYFQECLEIFLALLLSTVSSLNQISASNDFYVIPEKYELVKSFLNNIIPDSVFTSRRIRKKVNQAISEVGSRSFKTIAKAIIQVLLDNHHIILDSIVSRNNDLVYLDNNQTATKSCSPESESVIEDQPSSSMIEEQQQQAQEEMVHEEATTMESNFVDKTTVISDVNVIGDPPSHRYLICFFFLEIITNFNSYLTTSSLTLANDESFTTLLPPSCNRTSQSKKLRWLETLSHQQNVVPCDVVSTG
jgi:hypothetical protein